MNVLSLFDGMSCGQLALQKLGIQVNNYFASEIDPHVIKITQKNFPQTQQIGDVRDVRGDGLPKIDLLMGGSPCQGFSYAGNRLNFEDPRSVLFFEFERLLKECKPKYFLLENVRMKQEAQDIISTFLGVQPIAINSNLVSAQNRYRLYWTNIPVHDLPADKGIVLKDVLEDYVDVREQDKFDDTKAQKDISDNGLIMVGHATNINGHDCLKRIYSPEGKAPTLNACTGGNREPKAATGEHTYRKLTPLECERLQTVPDNYTEGVSNSQRYKMLGNGWTVDVIAHILKGINTHKDVESQDPSNQLLTPTPPIQQHLFV